MCCVCMHGELAGRERLLYLQYTAVRNAARGSLSAGVFGVHFHEPIPRTHPTPQLAANFEVPSALTQPLRLGCYAGTFDDGDGENREESFL